MVARLDLDAAHTGLGLSRSRMRSISIPASVAAALARRRPALYVETIADALRSDVAALLRATGSALGGRAPSTATGSLRRSDPERDARVALGEDAIQPPLASTCSLVAPDATLGVVLPPSGIAALDALVPRLAGAGGTPSVAIVVRGPRGSGRRAAAHRLARALGRPLFVIDTPALVALESRARVALFASALGAAFAMRCRSSWMPMRSRRARRHGRGTSRRAAAMPGVVLASTAKSDTSSAATGAVDAAAAPADDRDKAWSVRSSRSTSSRSRRSSPAAT
jgi:hypothetical protein